MTKISRRAMLETWLSHAGCYKADFPLLISFRRLRLSEYFFFKKVCLFLSLHNYDKEKIILLQTSQVPHCSEFILWAEKKMWFISKMNGVAWFFTFCSVSPNFPTVNTGFLGLEKKAFSFFYFCFSLNNKWWCRAGDHATKVSLTMCCGREFADAGRGSQPRTLSSKPGNVANWPLVRLVWLVQHCMHLWFSD